MSVKLIEILFFLLVFFAMWKLENSFIFPLLHFFVQVIFKIDISKFAKIKTFTNDMDKSNNAANQQEENKKIDNDRSFYNRSSSVDDGQKKTLKMDNVYSKISKYIGQEEISPNIDFYDKDFSKKMHEVGFYKGAAWCLFFVRLCWKELGLDYTKISPASAIVERQRVLSKVPVVGSVAIYALYSNGVYKGSGHGGLVVKVDNNGYTSIEGNTGRNGSREGLIVSEIYRTLSPLSFTKNGLRLRGFVHPIKKV